MLPELLSFFQALGQVRVPRGGAHVTSWYRDAAHNRSVGGAPDSQHTLALAIDVVTRDPRAFAVAAAAAGLQPIIERDHVHLQLLGAGVARRRGIFDRLVV